jgi:purine catabolism regulator
LQAEQAARIGRRFLGGDQVVSFADLGAYRLLASIDDRDTLTAFCDEYLGPLETYDIRSNAELVETLEGFFRANGNHARAAETLHLHRNTLLYRLGRVEALTGRNLDDPETRLCFQLALKIRHLTPIPAAPGKEFS